MPFYSDEPVNSVLIPPQVDKEASRAKIRELKRQISNKNRAARDVERAARAKERAEADGEVVEEDEEEEVDEDGEKLIDYDLAMQIQKCEQLMTFLGQYKAKETVMQHHLEACSVVFSLRSAVCRK